MICPFCNKEINEDSNFCKFCGKEIKKNEENLSLNHDKDNKNLFTKPLSGYSKLIATLILIITVLLVIFIPIIHDKMISPSPARYTHENYNTQEQSKPEIEVIDTSFCSDEWGSKYVCGTIKNNSTYSKRAIIVNINLYDSQNNLIGNTATVSGTLHSGTQWKFKAPIAQPNANRFEIVNIDD